MPVDPIEKAAYMNAGPMQRETARLCLVEILSVLRAQALSYQTSHWQCGGTEFYGNHLLFERLYGSVQDQIDQLAEKMVGYLGAESVSLESQLDHITGFCAVWGQVPCPHERGLLSESTLQDAIKHAYDRIKKVQAMTLGLDDWLMATANRHEENTYLLQQVKADPTGKTARAKLAGYTVIGVKPDGGQEMTFPRNWSGVKREMAALKRQGIMSGWVEDDSSGGRLSFREIRNHPSRPKFRMAVGPAAPSAEGHFFDNPEKREVREFAESDAVTNSSEVASEASVEDQLNTSKRVLVQDAEAAPPTPSDILEEPGASELSTLNRYQVASGEMSLAGWAAEFSEIPR